MEVTGQIYNNCALIMSDLELKNYLSIYKNICHSHLRLTLDVNDIEFCKYQLELLDNDFGCINDFNKCVEFCKENNINSCSCISNILSDYFNRNRHFINILKKHIDNLNLQKLDEPIPYSMRFVNLDSNRVYLSLDLKHAYSQYIDNLNILPDSFNNLFTNSLPYKYLRESKKIRIFTYNQFSNFIYEDNILYSILNALKCDHPLINKINEYNLKPVSYNVDELVFDITDCVEEFKPFIGQNYNINNYEFKVDIFIPHIVKYLDPDFDNKERKVNIRYLFSTQKHYFAQRQCKYMCQIYKAFYNLPLCEYDLYVPTENNSNIFYKMKEPIKITSIS